MAVLFWLFKSQTLPMKLYYRLWIATDGQSEAYNSISEILGILPDDIEDESNNNIWIYTKEQTETDAYFDFINEFLDLLEPNFPKLEDLGISCSDISIWKFYGYDQQCNMEFDPQRLKRLGDNYITLCISCWEE